MRHKQSKCHDLAARDKKQRLQAKASRAADASKVSMMTETLVTLDTKLQYETMRDCTSSLTCVSKNDPNTATHTLQSESMTSALERPRSRTWSLMKAHTHSQANAMLALRLRQCLALLRKPLLWKPPLQEEHS